MATPFSGDFYITDAAGAAVPGALIYTYEAGTLTPKSVYTTSALSVAKTNPVVAGANGRAQFFLGAGTYRIKVFTAAAVELPDYEEDNISGESTDALVDLASTASAALGDALMGVKSTLTGAVAETQHDFNARIVSVATFGAKPAAAAATNIAGILAAIASGAKIIRFPAGTYSLGTLSTTTTLFAVTGDGIRFVADGLVTFSFAYGANSTIPTLFSFAGCDDIRFDGQFKFTDSVGYDGSGIKGVKCFAIGQTNTNFTFEDVQFSGVLQGLSVTGTEDSRSVKNIRGKFKAVDSYYVVDHQQNGDHCVYDIHATNCRREYFAYGVRDHRVKLTMVNKNVGGTTLLTSFEVYTNATEDIHLDMTCIWATTPGGPMLYITHQPTTAGGTTPGIKNVTVKYNVIATTPISNVSVAAIHLTAAVNGGAAITTNCNCSTDNIQLIGTANGNYSYDILSEYTLTAGNTKGRAWWQYHAKVDAALTKVLTMDRVFTWTPTIGGGTWAIGNGTVKGRYAFLEGSHVLELWGSIEFGSTSVYDAGAALSVNLPAPVYRWVNETTFTSGHELNLTMVGMADIFDTSATAHYMVPVKTGATLGANLLVFHGTAASGYVLQGVPITFATGDKIDFRATLVRNNMTQLAP